MTEGAVAEKALEEQLARLLERAARRSDMAEVYCVRRNGTPVEFENNRLKTIATAEHAGVALRVVVDGRVGFSTTTKMDNLEDIIDYALASARYGGPAEFDLPGPDERPTPAETYDGAVTQLPVERMVEIGQRLLDPVRRLDPAIQAFAGVDREEGRILLLNSNGYSEQYGSTGLALWVGGELVESENMLWAYDGVQRGNLGDIESDIVRLAERVVEQFRLGRRNVPFKSGRYPVIFSPRALGDLLRPLVASLDGKAVEKGLSPWKDKLGRRVASPKVTLIDDGTVPFGPATAPFDGEGTPTRRTTLLAAGELHEFFLDRRTARLLKLKPTGNGLRGLGTLPSPGTTNLILEGGPRAYAEMLAGVEEGVLIEGLMGAWAGNPYSGEVQGNISLGLKIEKGRPVGRIKNCLFAANAFSAFADQLVELSSEREWSGAQLLPYALFDGIQIAADTRT